MPRRTDLVALDRFLAALAVTGNFALAAQRSGLAKSGLYKRRARDPAFAARIAAARADFARLVALRGERHPARPARPARPGRPVRPVDPALPQHLLTTPGEMILAAAGRRRPAQLRRSPAGRLTEAGVAAFLYTLEATCNVRLAARGVGVAPSSIYARRRHDAQFQRAMEIAIEIGFDRLSAALINAACVPASDHPAFAPLPHGYAFSLDQDPGFPPLTVDQALSLLTLHRNTAQLQGRLNIDRRRPRPLEEVRDRILRRLDNLARFHRWEEGQAEPSGEDDPEDHY